MVDCKKQKDVTDQYGNTPEEKERIIKESMEENNLTRAEALEQYKVSDQYGNSPEEKDKLIKQSMKDDNLTRAEALEYYKDFDNASLFPS